MSDRVYHSAARAALALVVGCAAPQSGPGSAPVEPGAASTCDGTEWGGWDGSAACAAIAHTPIPAADLSCVQDRDCVLVGRSSCGANSVARRAQARYADHAPACGHPAAGQCLPVEFVAECRGGCCSVGLAPTPSPH